MPYIKMEFRHASYGNAHENFRVLEKEKVYNKLGEYWFLN
jgi:hypothetical protein